MTCLKLNAAACALALAVGLPVLSPDAAAQTHRRDAIGELLAQNAGPAAAPATRSNGAQPQPPGPAATPEKDPREGDAAYEQARKLMAAIDAVLQDTARNRGDLKKLPSKEDFIVTPLWTETREDRERKVRDLLDAALGIVTDAPVVDVQKKIEGLRRNIREIEDGIIKLKEKQLTAPKDGVLPGVLTDTVDSISASIEESRKRIEANRGEIAAAKDEIRSALKTSGVEMKPEQVDLLLDSVLSGDLVRLVAVFNAAKQIDGQLAKLMSVAGDNMGATRKYFAMHAVLFAMLVHAQDMTITKIDTQYLPKLNAILKDIETAKAKTAELMRAENRPDQKRVLDANRESQKLAEDAAKAYRRYLTQQREQIAKARARATHDLRIADNTFETVEASYQLRNLMRDSSSSFEALQKLEAPTFEQIFKNEELRREFENLTRKLDVPSS